MLAAVELSDVLAVLGVLGLGGLIGAYATHLLTQRRERSARDRARIDRQEDADREQVVLVGDAIQAIRRQFGGFPSQVVDDGTRVDWGDEERGRAVEYAVALDELRGTLQGAKRRINDAHLRSELGWTEQLIGLACEALREVQPSPAAFLVHNGLTVLEADIDAFLHDGNPPDSDLQWAFYNELADSIRQWDHAPTKGALMSRIQGRLTERTPPSS